MIIAQLKLDVPSIVTGLLHDVVEDTHASLAEVQAAFGPEVAQLVDGVTKVSKITFQSREEKQAENFRKMIIAMANDIRVVLIKLADRLHNMRTLDHLSAERQQEIARETMEIYAPIAHRLGIYWLKSELEDLAFRYLNPSAYQALKAFVAAKRKEREEYIANVIAILSRRMSDSGVTAEVTGRPKHFFSIHSKMQELGLSFEEIYDLVAFRIIVDTVRECYEALGVVHANWKPVPGRFKDYIALPKANMYQSLHTTVIGPRGQRMEVQIRTREMHKVAEEGIAAHWSYKDGNSKRAQGHRALRMAAAADRMAAESEGPAGISVDGQGRSVSRGSFRLYAQGRRVRFSARLDGDRFRVSNPFAGRQSSGGRARQRAHGAAALPAAIGRHGRGAHVRKAGAGQGLDELRGDRAREIAHPAMAAQSTGGALARSRNIADRSRARTAQAQRYAAEIEQATRQRCSRNFRSATSMDCSRRSATE